MRAIRLVILVVVLLDVVNISVAEAGMILVRAHRLGETQPVITTARLRELRRRVGKMIGIGTEFETIHPTGDTATVLLYHELPQHHLAGMTATGTIVDLGTIHRLTVEIGIITDGRHHQPMNETVLHILIGPPSPLGGGTDRTPGIVCGIEMYIGLEMRGEGRGRGSVL